MQPMFLQRMHDISDLRCGKSHGFQFLIMGKNLLRLIIKYSFSVIHNNEALHVFRNILHAVGNQNNGYPSHLMKLCDLIQDIIPALRVKPCCGLVQDQNLRVHGKNPCNSYSFFLASGKLKG